MVPLAHRTPSSFDAYHGAEHTQELFGNVFRTSSWSSLSGITATARRTLLFIARISANYTITIAVWTGFHCVPPLVNVVAEKSPKRNSCSNDDIPDNETNDEIAESKDIFHRPQVHMENEGRCRGAESRYKSEDEIANYPGDSDPSYPYF
jgi:hypothetical protein